MKNSISLQSIALKNNLFVSYILVYVFLKVVLFFGYNNVQYLNNTK